VFHEYKKIKGKSVADAVKSEFSGDLKGGLLMVVNSIEDPHAFLAERLKGAMRGAGTNDRDLIRLVVTRSELDLGSIKDTYARMYGKSLESDIKSDTSGDYKKMLVALCEE